MESLPGCNASHITGSLLLIAPLTKHLQVLPIPHGALYGDRADVIQDIGVTRAIGAFKSIELIDLLLAACTKADLLIEDERTHLIPGLMSLPIFSSAGGFATYCRTVAGLEITPLTPTGGAGPTSEPVLLLCSVGHPAIFTHGHLGISRTGRVNETPRPKGRGFLSFLRFILALYIFRQYVKGYLSG